MMRTIPSLLPVAFLVHLDHGVDGRWMSGNLSLMSSQPD